MADSSPVNAKLPSTTDLEVKDAPLIFSAVWDDLVQKRGKENLRFPQEFIWLGGAPGAGKGTNTPFIMKARDITAPPIIVSSLLDTPAMKALKNAARMVGDREVIGLLFEELLKPEYRDGVIVDGFPRTPVQVECLKRFHDKMLSLQKEFRTTPLAKEFPKPLFRIAMLYVGEDVSVARQLKRGREILAHNERVRQTGVGSLLEERVTDLDPEKCRKRYKTYRDTTYDALQSLRDFFHYYHIDAEGDLPEVQENILREFSYQSSLELSHEVFDLIRTL
jgi:adenylate kinase